MNTKKSINFGSRGWVLVFYQAMALMIHTVFNNFVQNIQASTNAAAFGWNTTLVSTCFTIGTIIGVILNFAFGSKMSSARNVKMLTVIFGFASMAINLGVMLITNQTVWLVFYVLSRILTTLWATFLVGVLVGQWFPKRKGTVMGVATFMIPVTSGILMSIFSSLAAKYGIFLGYLPFYLIGILSIILCLVFLTDYPEQCGCYPDNDKTLDISNADQIIKREIAAKKQSVWTYKNTLKCRDFWFIAIPEGFLLFGAVGLMTRIVPILMGYNAQLAPVGGFHTVLVCISLCACFGSWLLGVIDTKFGTKVAIVTCCILMALCGLFGFIGTLPTTLLACACMAIFMGGGSNFTVSASAEYWGREDFPSVFSLMNPVANVLNAFGPTVLALIVTATGGYAMCYALVGVFGIAGAILACFISREHVASKTAEYKNAVKA